MKNYSVMRFLFGYLQPARIYISGHLFYFIYFFTRHITFFADFHFLVPPTKFSIALIFKSLTADSYLFT